MQCTHGRAAFADVVAKDSMSYCKVTVQETKDTDMIRPLKALAAKLRRPSEQEREFAYLSEAHDLVDLEYRQRQIDQGYLRSR